MVGLLIVDDERIIREGIKNAANWNEHDIEVVGLASNGVQALELFKLYEPKIVVSDVKMPKMNGIELIKNIRMLDEEAKIIILSGYDEFDYVREALHSGVSDYVLKPILPQDLVKLIIDMKEVYLLENAKKNNQIRLWKQIEENLPVIKERFFNDMAEGLQLTNKALKEKLDFLGLNIKPESVCTVIIVHLDSFENLTENFPEQNRQIIHYMAMEEIKAALDGKGEVWPILTGEYGVVVFDFDGMEDKIYAVADDIRKNIQSGCGLSVTVAIGDAHTGMLELHKSYKEARAALKYRMILGSDQIIRYRDINENVVNGLMYSQGAEDDILFAIKSADIDCAKKNVKNFFENNIKNTHPKYVKGLCMKLIISISMCIMEMDENVNEIMGSSIDAFADIEASESYEQLELIIISIVEKVVNSIIKSRSKSGSPIVEKIIEYLKEHYNESFSLKKIADTVYLSPNYICNLFKQNTGQNIGDYIIMLRIEKAKELLKETKYRIYEVANMVGYNDSRYFGSLFKRHTGMSLGEYREICAEGRKV